MILRVLEMDGSHKDGFDLSGLEGITEAAAQVTLNLGGSVNKIVKVTPAQFYTHLKDWLNVPTQSKDGIYTGFVQDGYSEITETS